MRKTRWRCSCGFRYQDGRKRKCPDCGAARKVKSVPKHLAALSLGRAEFISANGGLDLCGICGAAQKVGGKRLHRDHDHRTGKPRGILCFRCNAALRPYMTLEWCLSAARYLGRK